MSNPYEQIQRVYITEPISYQDSQTRPARVPNSRFTLGDSPLGRTIINFPFTPTLSIDGNASYGGYNLTHTNYQQRVFEQGNNAEISVIAPILVRNEAEALSVVSMADFFRASLKMNFGLNDPNKGLPPPILNFNAYGVYKNVPVVVTAFQWNFENDVDYVEFTLDGEPAFVPVSSTFVVSLSTTYPPKRVRDEFNLKDFATGGLRNKGYI